MRIHHLTLEAVGPFAGRHDIDLDQLSAGGLFLLEGPTGSGKSTLIDAITFGLYGSLGTPAQDDRLPSAHAAGTEPVVEVVFSTGAGIFRVRRTPAFHRPKHRGEGTTRQNATARLWRLESVTDEAGEPLATTAQEVGTEVLRIVGLSRGQFSQTVVLPQGRFSTFLRAKPDERAAVLRDVFGTEVYQRVQEQLVEMARVARRELGAAQQEVTTCVASLTSLLGEDDPTVASLEQAAADLDPVILGEAAAAVVARAEAELFSAERLRDQARTAERAAQAEVDAQRDLAQRVVRRRALLAEEETLQQREATVASHRAQVAAAHRAAVAAGALRSHAGAQTAMAEAEHLLERSCAEAGDGEDADLTDLELTDLRDVVEQLSGERGGLLELLELEAGLAAQEAELVRDDAALAERRTALEARRAELTARPEERTRLATALDRIQREAMSVPAAQAAVDTRRTVREAARDAEHRLAELTAAEAAVTAAAATARSASHEEQEVRRRWIAGMSGSLAEQLTPGSPCSVCGATEHPAPAPRSPEHTTVQEVDAATARRTAAEAALAAVREDRAQAEARLRAAQEACGGTGLTDADEALAVAEQDLADAQQAVQRAERRKQELAAFDATTERLQADRGQEENALATATEHLRGRRTAWAKDRERCRTGAAGAASVAARVRRLETRLGTARRVVQAREAHHLAGRRLADTTAALTQTLEETGFADAEAARAAQLPGGRVTELEQDVADHAAAHARVRAGLAEAPIASLTGQEVPAVGPAEAAHAERHATLITASEAAARAEDTLTRLHRCRSALTGVLDAHRAATERSAPVLRMGELAAAGDGNARATTLSTYVLLRRFEDVVAAANDRLGVMSDGRFALRRIDEREGRSRKAGLGLTVHDHLTETSRDPHTLSGGETFYVSLCLALGLADVVTSEAGGIALDTLFVDEGFGSLDPHTLEGVLGELGRLQAGGRAVGIVSHVTELKDRIAERIEVRRLDSGASTLTVRA